MAAFSIQLQAGETLVIGPVTFSSSASFNFSSGGAQAAQTSQVKTRLIGLTNRRTILEQSGQAPQTIAHSDVRRVYLRRERGSSKLEKIETRSGQTIKLDLGLTPLQDAHLFEIFPDAEIGRSKGLFGGFQCLDPLPLPAPAARQQPAPRAAQKPKAPATARRVPQAAASTGSSYIKDDDIHSLEDLQRYYPLPKEYEYFKTANDEYRVRRPSDGADFPILLEEGMLGFDVPVQDPRRKKVTVEIIKKV